MSRILAMIILLWVSLFTGCDAPSTKTKPVIISTIKPIHALVYAIAGGENAPFELKQLLPDGASPHQYALKPSERLLLEHAKIVFQIDPQMETFLGHTLNNLSETVPVISLAQAQGIQTLPLRAGHSTNTNAAHDLHIWLNPLNGIAMARSITANLSRIYPEHKTQFETNAAHLISEITAMDEHLKTQLSSIKTKSYISFHDAWQHFDTHFGLNFVGAVTLDVSRQTGARHLQNLRQLIETQHVVCLFQEPQFPPALVKTLAEGTSLRIGTLDPLGVGLPINNTTYLTLLNHAAQGFETCLQP